MIRRLAPAALAGFVLTACATEPPQCREASQGERDLFGVFVAGDAVRLADTIAPADPALAGELRDMDPDIRRQIFGERMGDRSVRSVLMSDPPLCLYDQQVSETERITYAFPEGRFQSLHPEGQLEFNPGRPGVDSIACRFETVNESWVLSDACLQTFAPPPEPQAS